MTKKKGGENISALNQIQEGGDYLKQKQQSKNKAGWHLREPEGKKARKHCAPFDHAFKSRACERTVRNGGAKVCAQNCGVSWNPEEKEVMSIDNE